MPGLASAAYQCDALNTIGNAAGTNIAYKSQVDYGDSSDASTLETYGLIENGTFAVDYGDKGVIRGRAYCSAQNGTNNSERWTDPTISTTFPDSIPDGRYCYCQLDGYTSSGGSIIAISEPWVFWRQMDGTSNCKRYCAGSCAIFLQVATDNTLPFRSAMFSNAQCSANVDPSAGEGAGDSNGIKIASVNYNANQFSPIKTQMASIVTDINTIVGTTITQANSIETLATTKQDRPATDCPSGKKCLLVKNPAGVDTWYPIVEAVLLSDIIGTAAATGSALGSAFKSNDGNLDSGAQTLSTYNITENGTFAVDYGDAGVIRGHAQCSSQSGINNDNTWTDPTISATLPDSSGQYCYCQLDSYTSSGGSTIALSRPWVFDSQLGNCATYCALYCPGAFHNELNFRAAMCGDITITN